MNKTLEKKIRVEERKSMRVKQAQSKFMQKTLSIYRGQVNRAKKEGVTLPYSLAELRDAVDGCLIEGFCPYTCDKLTLANLAADHDQPISRGGSWELENLTFCTKSANFQKGILNGHEFYRLLDFLNTLEPEVAADVKRRLTTGGKWLAKKF